MALTIFFTFGSSKRYYQYWLTSTNETWSTLTIAVQSLSCGLTAMHHTVNCHYAIPNFQEAEERGVKSDIIAGIA
jgi:hypothetical protein